VFQVRTGQQAFSVAAVVLMLAAVQATAATYTWTPTTAGTYSWDDATSQWTSGFPNAAGDIANLNINLAGDQANNLNRTITVGGISIGDTGSTYYGMTIAPGTAGSLVLDVTSGSAFISKSTAANTTTDVISVNIQLNDNLVVTNAATASSGVLTISGDISGSSYTITKGGAGVLSLNGSTTVGSLYADAGSVLSLGTLSVGNGLSSRLYVGTAYSISNTGTFDLNDAASLTANVGRLYIGVCADSAGGTGNGTLRLGNNTSITATNVVIGGSFPEANTGANNRGQVTVASGATVTIDTSLLIIASTKSEGGANTFTLLGSGATLNLGVNPGISTNRTALYIGRKLTGAPTGKTYSGDMNLSAGTGNLYLNQLVLAIDLGGTASGGNNIIGSLTLGSSASNVLNISGTNTPVKVGYTDSTTADGGTVNGTLSIDNLASGSEIAVTDGTTAIMLAQKAGNASAATGMLNLNGGMLTITTAGSGIKGGGGTARLNLKNCTLIAGASSTNWIQGLTTATFTNIVTINSGTNSLVIPQGFSGTGSLVKSGTGLLRLSGSNTYSGGTTVSNGALVVNGTITNAVNVASGAGFGGSGTVVGNVTLTNDSYGVFVHDDPLAITGNLILTNNVIHLNLSTGVTNGVYRLVDVLSGSISGQFSPMAVIDSGSAQGSPTIVSGINYVDLKLIPPGLVIMLF